MKRLLMFFAGVILLALCGGALYLAGMLFDLGDARKINAFVMQPNNLSTDRIGAPVPMEERSETFIRNSLIRKFIYEYFYVNPDAENIATRMRGNSVLAAMSTPSVFQEWTDNTAQDITEMARARQMRTTRIGDIVLPPGGDYWYVSYDLLTWDTPNDMGAAPIVTGGVILLKITFFKELRDMRGGAKFDIKKYLDNGGDPAAIFKFRVDEVRI